MPYTLGQAAKATGKSKPTIANAIETGRLSATKDAFGRWQIDPAELHRIYTKNLTISNDTEHAERQIDGNEAAEIKRLKATVEGLEKLCRQIEGERDSLRTQLAEAHEERRTTLRQLTALLTDQRAKAPAPDVIVTQPPMPTAIITPSPERPVAISPASVNEAPAKEASWLRRMMGGK